MNASRKDGKGELRRRSLTAGDYQALGAFRFALRRFLAFSEDMARNHGLTPQQHQVLLAIRSHEGSEPLTIGELAQWLMIKNHSAVELVGRLVERGLVTRQASHLDRRRILLAITPDGQAKLEAISRANLRELGRATGAFRELEGALRRLAAEDGGDV